VEQVLIPRRVQMSENQDRLTIKINVYFETFGENPLGEALTISELLTTKGIEPYIRKFKATETPRELFIGDIPREDVGYLLVSNTEGTKLVCNPSEEEKVDILKRVAVLDGFEIAPYNMPFLGKPKQDSPLLVHCLHGQAMLQVCVFPR